MTYLNLCLQVVFLTCEIYIGSTYFNLKDENHGSDMLFYFLIGFVTFIGSGIVIYSIFYISVAKHVARKQTTSRCRNISVRIYKSSRFGVIVAGLQVIQPRFGWILLCTQERLSPSRDLLFRAVPAEKANVTALYQVPASIAFVIPQRQNLSGVLLKPLRAWDYPSSRPFVPKRRCLLARWHSSPRKCYRFYL